MNWNKDCPNSVKTIQLNNKTYPMKVIAFNGSPRKGGNTEQMIKAVFGPLEKAGIECELVQIGGKPVRGCTACRKCREKEPGKCTIKDDIVNKCIKKARKADGIILGSPTYFADVTAEMKALIDRLGYVSMGDGRFLERKVGAAVVAVRRGGSIHAFDTMNHLMQISGMYIVGSTYWNLGIGRNKGDVKQDSEGLKNMQDLGSNMAWLLKKINK